MKTERWEATMAAIAQLPELEQELLRLQEEGKSYEEMAAILGVSKSVVGHRLSRAKARLRPWAEAWKVADAEGEDLEFSAFEEKKGKS